MSFREHFINRPLLIGSSRIFIYIDNKKLLSIWKTVLQLQLIIFFSILFPVDLFIFVNKSKVCFDYSKFTNLINVLFCSTEKKFLFKLLKIFLIKTK